MNDKSKVQCPVVRVQARIGAIVAGGVTFLGDVTAFKHGDLAILADAGRVKPWAGTVISADGNRYLMPGMNTKGGLVVAKQLEVFDDWHGMFARREIGHFGEGDDAAEFLGVKTPESKPAASWPFPTGTKPPADACAGFKLPDTNAVGPKYATLGEELRALQARVQKENEDRIERNWIATTGRLAELLREFVVGGRPILTVAVKSPAILTKLQEWAKSQGILTATQAVKGLYSTHVGLMLSFAVMGDTPFCRINEEGRLV